MAQRLPGDRTGLALLASGLLLLVVSLIVAPRPASEPWTDGEPPRALSVRGPAAASRYDAAEERSPVSFLCGHGHCYSAVWIDGDAGAAAARERAYLVRVARDAPTSVEPPLEIVAPPTNVSFALPALYDARPFWPAFLLAPAGALLALAGTLRLRAPEEGMRASVAAAIGGAIGAFFASFPGNAIVWGYLYVVAACLLSLVAMSVQKWRKGRWAAAAFALATVAMFVWARPWFPGMPSL